MLEIFGWVWDRLGPITAPERELQWREEKIDPVSTSVGEVWLGPVLVQDIWSG